MESRGRWPFAPGFGDDASPQPPNGCAADDLKGRQPRKFFWPPLGWPTTAQWMSGGLRGAERAERGDNFLEPRMKLDGFG